MILFGHILFGTLSMIGTLLLAIGFRNDFANLTGVQQLAIGITIISIFATIAMGLFAIGSVLNAILMIALAVVFVAYLARDTFATLLKRNK